MPRLEKLNDTPKRVKMRDMLKEKFCPVCGFWYEWSREGLVTHQYGGYTIYHLAGISATKRLLSWISASKRNYVRKHRKPFYNGCGAKLKKRHAAPAMSGGWAVGFEQTEKISQSVKKRNQEVY